MPERVAPNRTGLPRIEAILLDGSHHTLTPHVLDVMLDNDRVLKFKRATGWVTVGIDPVRVNCTKDVFHSYYGQERRRTASAMARQPYL